MQSTNYAIRSGGGHLFGLMIHPSTKRGFQVKLIGSPGAVYNAVDGLLARHGHSLAAILKSMSQSGSAGNMLATADQSEPAVFTPDGIDLLERGATDAMRNNKTPFQMTDMGRQTASVRGEFASNPAK